MGLDRALQGQPDSVLTVLLLTLAVIGAAVALLAPPLAKAGLLAWWLLP